jgi:hypothetical protein
MPRLSINYQNTIIYKICCKDINITDTYVGHTTNFDKRKNQHKTSCNNENNKSYNCYVYQFIRDNGNWNNWEMIEIELYSCENKRQAETRERYWLETLGATLNQVIPTRTKQEYQKEYYHENREILNEKHKEWYEANKEQISEYQKDYQKEYYEANNDILLKKKREYYEANKEKILENFKEKITCECGCELTKSNLPKHRKTKKHLDNLNNLNNLI